MERTHPLSVVRLSIVLKNIRICKFPFLWYFQIRDDDYLSVGSVPRTDRLGNGLYIEENARPAILTVFSTTQLGHSIRLLSIHDITDLKMQPMLDRRYKNKYNSIMQEIPVR